MAAAIRHRKVRIIHQGLRLLQQCKVPRFSATDPTELEQQQSAWSNRPVRWLHRLLRFIDLHRITLFEQDWEPSSGRFRKQFVLVYFEQIATVYERAKYQADIQLVFGLESRLEEYHDEVYRILSKTSNGALRNWLFHHYGSTLGKEDWPNQPGELYGFVRLACFLVQRTKTPAMFLNSRMRSLAETFGLRLLGERRNGAYQMLGIRLLDAVMNYSYRNNDFTSNVERILELTLRMVLKQDHENGERALNIVYHSVRSMQIPNPSLDDDVMRGLVSHLLQDNVLGVDTNCLETLIRILLLELPDVRMDEENCEQLYLLDEIISERWLCHYLVRCYQTNDAPSRLRRRFSIRWKLRIGRMIPRLVGRIIRCAAESYYIEHTAMHSLSVLMLLVMFPIGRTWHQKRARSAMVLGVFGELIVEVTKMLRTVQNRQDMHNINALQALQTVYDNTILMFWRAVDGIRVLSFDYMNWGRQNVVRRRRGIHAIIANSELGVKGVQMVIQNVQIFLGQSLTSNDLEIQQ